MDFIFNTYRFIKPLNVEFLGINNKFILFRSMLLFLCKINTLKKCLRLISSKKKNDPKIEKQNV